MTGKIVPIDKEKIERFFPFAENYLRKSLKYDGCHSLDDLYNLCKNGEMKLWLFYNSHRIEGAFITELISYPCKMVMTITHMGADNFEGLIENLHNLKEWARTNQADEIEVIGRLGWDKVLVPHGFEKTHTIMRLSL